MKKALYILFITLFYLTLKGEHISAKEYCHIYVNDEFKETIELPFYFYTVKETTTIVSSWPKQTYSSSYEKIDSTTKCESINVKVTGTGSNSIIGTITRYDYTKKTYSSDHYQIYHQAKFRSTGSTIKGYGKTNDEEPPAIKGYKDLYTSNIDSPISLSTIMQNITAYDERDGNLTSNIIIEYNDYEANINRIGIYPIIISVTDSSNNKTSITFNIEVKDLTNPIISGKQIYVSTISSPLSLEAIQSNITVEDNVDKNLESKLYICSDTYTPNKNITGLYEIYLCVKDSSQNEATPYKISIEVKDDIIPIIQGINNYTTYLSNPITVKQIMTSLIALDNNQDISTSIFVVNDYYSNHQNTIGEKSIIFQVMDDSLNLSSPFKVTIDLKDDIKPQIYGLNIFTSYLSTPLSTTYLKQQLTVLDNYDGNISNNLEIIDDTYSTNINKKGTYYISFQAKDNSENKSEIFKVSITNIDDVPPTIKGPQVLKYEINNKPTIENILSEYQAIDNIDNNLSINILESSYNSASTTGTYYISLFCIDSAENKSPTFTIKIELVDILLNLNELSLLLPISHNYSVEEINKAINFFEPYKIIQNTYTANYNQIGTYTLEYELENLSTITIKITTYQDTKITESKSKTQKKETFLSKIKSFFNTILNYIKNFFKNIFILYICLSYFL